MQRLLLKWIRWYQKSGGSRRFFNTSCNFNPTCSEYTYQAIERFGSWHGVRMGWHRIKRCNDPDCCTIIDDPVPLQPTKESAS